MRKLSDGHGLQLHISPAGSKLWRLAYRFEGKQQTLTFGAYPQITLAPARERSLEARRQLAEGTNPQEARKLERITGAVAKADTFEAVANELLAKRIKEGIAVATRNKTAIPKHKPDQHAEDRHIGKAQPFWWEPMRRSCDGFALRNQDVDLLQLLDDLFRLVALSRNESDRPRCQKAYFKVDQFNGGGAEP